MFSLDKVYWFIWQNNEDPDETFYRIPRNIKWENPPEWTSSIRYQNSRVIKILILSRTLFLQYSKWFFLKNILNHIRLWTWSKIIVKVTTSTLFIRLVTKNNRKEGRNEEKERQTYRFFSGWSDSSYIWLFKRPTIADSSLRIDAVWSALLLFAHKYFWVYLFSMLKSAFRKGCNVLCTSGHNAWIMNYTRKQQHML